MGTLRVHVGKDRYEVKRKVRRGGGAEEVADGGN
jgi:hypothetical protein